MKTSALASAPLAAGLYLLAIPASAAVRAPRNTPYTAGALKISVDATDTVHRIFRVHEVIPAAPAQRAPLPYRNYQASEDYYSAGQLIWLDVDGKLRDLTGGKKSLDDFAKAFFGVNPGKWDVDTYTPSRMW